MYAVLCRSRDADFVNVGFLKSRGPHSVCLELSRNLNGYILSVIII